MMVQVLDPGVQAEEFLRSFPPFESLLLSFLTPCRSVRLDVTPISRSILIATR